LGRTAGLERHGPRSYSKAGLLLLTSQIPPGKRRGRGGALDFRRRARPADSSARGLNDDEAALQSFNIGGSQKLFNQKVHRDWAKLVWPEDENSRMSARRVFFQVREFHIERKQDAPFAAGSGGDGGIRLGEQVFVPCGGSFVSERWEDFFEVPGQILVQLKPHVLQETFQTLSRESSAA